MKNVGGYCCKNSTQLTVNVGIVICLLELVVIIVANDSSAKDFT
jgi:hypothetical protein